MGSADLDMVDVAILGALKAEEKLTSVQIARLLMQTDSPISDFVVDEPDRTAVKNMDSRVRYRLKKLGDMSLINVLNGTRTTYYFLNQAVVQWGDGSLNLITDEGIELQADIGRVLAIWGSNGKVSLIELELL